MEENIDNLSDSDVEKSEQKDVKIIFDGQHINIRGNPEQIKKIVSDILEMNEKNKKGGSAVSIRDVNNTLEGRSKFPFSADILTPLNKMVRLYIEPPIENKIEVNLGGGGNLTPPEEMKKEIEKATGLTF